MISVIVPVYNTVEYLGQCVESILNQTYQDIEIFLIDDGSTDGAGALCDYYAEMYARVTVIHQKNSGVSAARNNALKRIHGDWVSFIDSDDWLEDTMYEKMITLAKKSQSDIVECEVYDEKESGTGLRNIWGMSDENEAVHEGSARWLFGLAYTPALWNKLIKTELICGTQFSENCRYGEDALFLTEAMRNAKRISCSSVYLYHYRSERAGNVFSASISDKIFDFLQSYGEICETLVQIGQDEAAGQLVYTTAVQVISKLSLKGDMSRYCKELKRFINKYNAQFRLIYPNYRRSRLRIILVKIARLSPMLSAALWNGKEVLKGR